MLVFVMFTALSKLIPPNVEIMPVKFTMPAVAFSNVMLDWLCKEGKPMKLVVLPPNLLYNGIEMFSVTFNVLFTENVMLDMLSAALHAQVYVPEVKINELDNDALLPDAEVE